jgi:Dolichyl-phosphate-mannose-protein mannosyltransferase
MISREDRVEIGHSRKVLSRRAFETVLLLAVGAIFIISNPSVSFIDDEVNIVSAAAAPLHQTLYAFQIGQGLHEHPPLYDVLLHCWMWLTSAAFSMLRLPSIVCYLLGLWLLARAAGKIAGERSALATLWLGALWPFGYHYGRLAAWYPFCFLIVAALTLAYLSLIQQPSISRWSVTMLLGLALVYTNYFGWAMLVCLAIDIVLCHPQDLRRVSGLALASGLLLGIAYLPLWLAFRNELRTGLSFRHTLVATVLLAGFNVYNAFASESVAPWVWVLGIPAFLCVTAELLLVLKYAPLQAKRLLLYGLTLVALMAVLGIATSKRMLPVAAWLLLPVGVTVGVIPRGRGRMVFSGAVAVVMLIGWFGIFARRFYSAPRFVEPWHEVAAEAAERSRSGAVVIGNNPSFFFYLTYALHPPGQPGGWEMLQNSSGSGVFDAEDWIEIGRPLRHEVFLVRGMPGPLSAGPSWDDEQWLNSHCVLMASRQLLRDPAAELKARFLPELGELPWRVRTRDYFCIDHKNNQ